MIIRRSGINSPKRCAHGVAGGAHHGVSDRVSARVLSCVLLFTSLLVVSASAQERPSQVRTVPSQVRPLLRLAEPTLDVPTVQQRDSRWDASHGIDRARYRIASGADLSADRRPLALRPTRELVRAGETYLDASRARYGLTAVTSDLALVSVKRSEFSAHVTWQQQIAGVLVHARFVRVSLDGSGQPTFVVNGVDSDLAARLRRNGISLGRLTPNVTIEEGRMAAASLFGAPGASTIAEATLVVLPDSIPRLAWRVLLQSIQFQGDWEVLVDAMTGAPIRVRDRAIRRRAVSVAVEEPSASVNASNWKPVEPSMLNGMPVRADGSGRAFEPDPLTSAGAPYGSPFIDDDDNDAVAINAELVDVVLHDITLGLDTNYRLEGPYARIIGGGSLNYSPPAESSPGGFVYTRSNDFFEAVNAYYHVDQSQRYVQSLGFTDIQVNDVYINPQAFATDNSLYLPSNNQLSFGTGGVDDAEDAGVIWHEYGHALLNDSAPGLIDGGEGQALHEGWADYWAGSYLRGLVEAGKSTRQDWESVFRWDSGDGAIWEGRSIGVPGVYPDDTYCDSAGGTQGACDIYADGLLWATVLMEIYDELGKITSDRLNLQSHQYIIAPATFRDAAEALLQADQDLFAGANTAVLVDVLTSRGYLLPNSAAPLVEHEPLRDTESVGGTLTVAASASSPIAAIDSVRIVYRFEGESDRMQRLQHSSGSQFALQFSLPSEPGMVEYQIEVFDSEGRRSVLPENAPIERFAFFVGPDNMSPDVTHIPVVSISTITWPPVVTVEATDNLAIASVAVTWTLRDADGTQRGNGVFELVGTGGDSFQGPFPLGRSDVSDDSTIEYYIVATDAAQAANTKRHPLAGTHVTTVVSSGVLLSLDFEDAATSMVAGGRWERGVPAGPLSVAHSGVNTWATGLAAPYPATPQSSSLALPSFDLTGSNAKLIFWHWHDFEHRGDVAPGEDNSSASLWDGGNVKISVNGGTWSVAVPDGGYTGNLSASGGNPLAGQPVFGGYSFGWRREVISLPSAADVRVRFDFGTDSSNDETSVAFAGWYIDDVVVTTELPVDIESPVVEVRPPSRIVKPAATSATSLAARLVDDVGVDRVELVPEPGSKVVVPVQRFSMSFSDVDVYVLDVDLPEVMPGDWLSYRIRSVDFAGNEDLVPAPTEAPLVVDFRTVGTVSALTDAVGSGAWQRFGTTWRAGSALVGEGGSAVARSGLILAPLTVADNAEDVRLLITHSYQLDDASGGNVKVSSDDGSTWHVLDPDGGYGAIWLASSDHPMAGESVFRGVRSSAVDTFDVSDYVGIPIRLRIDGGYSPTSAPTSFWSVTDVSLETISEESEINVPLALALDANFPDPFATTTTLTYTLPQDDLVQVGVFDVLGRRVRVLLFQQQEAGVHTLQLEASGLADGMYFVQLNAGGLRATESVVVRR